MIVVAVAIGLFVLIVLAPLFNSGDHTDGEEGRLL